VAKLLPWSNLGRNSVATGVWVPLIPSTGFGDNKPLCLSTPNYSRLILISQGTCNSAPRKEGFFGWGPEILGEKRVFLRRDCFPN